MQFSVVGLPHYTIWHLYEPSVDDIRHMEEMEQERKAREAEEEERQKRMKKIKEQFDDPNGQWEKDKTDIQDEAMREKNAQEEKQLLEDTKPYGQIPEAEVAQSPDPADKAFRGLNSDEAIR
jgi:mannan polymerase II complex ANP1 subunit